MAVDNPSVAFLNGLPNIGVDFRNMLTLGRQGLIADERGLAKFVKQRRLGEAADFIRDSGQWADRFFQEMGATNLQSMDASDYENATIVHDLNTPIPAALRERFSLVHDGGTLEHIFNFPNAVRSAMEMVSVGGHLTTITVANNYLGHGFYQFSPELMYRVFCEENGFEVKQMLLHEQIPNGRWFSVQDPKRLGNRVMLRNQHFTYMLVIAKRIAVREIFAKWPHQSDYVSNYQGVATTESQARKRTDPAGRIKRLVPVFLKDLAKTIFRYHPIQSFTEACYYPVSEGQVFNGQYPENPFDPPHPGTP